MKKFKVIRIVIFSLFLFAGGKVSGQPGGVNQEIDLSKNPVLYTVGYAHLDTEWRWDYDETVKLFLGKTLRENFRLFRQYPSYVFTFSGARRYKMFREYYPDLYDTLKGFIAAGRWHVGGSSVDECDVNVPSPESVIRQVLYGNQFFRSEYGKESVDFMLPDCFGFQAHLPSVLAHSGLKGFSTQKLSWGSASGIPFNIGLWTGPDGKGIVSALNATDYNGRVTPRIDTAKYWVNRVMDNGKKYGVFADYRYYGVGDTGGSPREEDIRNAVESASKKNSEIKVLLTSSDQFFRDLKPTQAQNLPTYHGDLLLTEHSAGSITSQAYMKRWNRKNEQLAQAAETAATVADWLGGIPYPHDALKEAWWLVLGSQMHDILPGTSIPKAYDYAWNDEVIAMNRFAAQLKTSAEVVVRAMDTRAKGKCIVVYNPLSIKRTDVVEAKVTFPEGVPAALMLLDYDQDTVPFQILGTSGSSVTIIFNASLPSLGFASYDLCAADRPIKLRSDLSVGAKMIDNEFLKVTLNDQGDISSVIDKKLGRELLKAPIRLELRREHPAYWPAWNMDWTDRQKPPLAFVGGPATITVVEKGPVRSALQVVRKYGNSVFTQNISLSAGSTQLVVRNMVEWQTPGVSLKAVFPLTCANDVATYNLGLGTIQRSTNNEKKYEVPSREWFDLTDQSGKFGVTILEDCKFGSDKPDRTTLRLTLLFTPETNAFHDQASQDFGVHEFSFGLYSHAGDWRTGGSEWQGRRFNQPLVAFQAGSHPGVLGRSFSLASVSDPNVDIRSIKKAENGKDIIVRLQELSGKAHENVEISFASGIIRAWEVDGQERMTGVAELQKGKLTTAMEGFAVRSFAIQPAPSKSYLMAPASLELPLIFNQDVISSDVDRKDGNFHDGLTFPAELFPETITVNGIHFNLGPVARGKANVMRCQEQKISLPSTGNYNRAYILAAAIGDTTGQFRAGNAKATLRISGWNGRIGQADRRTWDKLGRLSGLEPGFIKRDEVAWFSTHLHSDSANLPYQYGYLYIYSMEVTPSSKFIQLPENEAIKIFAITLSENSYDDLQPAHALYDDFSGRPTLKLSLPDSRVKDSDQPVADLQYHRRRSLTELPARLTMRDYADMHQPNGTTVRFYFTGADSSFTTKGAAGKITDGMIISAANDGMFELLPSDSLLDRYSRSGEGRIVVDFQKEIELDSLHLFAQQSLITGSRSFSAWGFPDRSSPQFNVDPGGTGWKFLAYSAPEELWGNNKSLIRMTPLAGEKVRCRYLMFVSDNRPYGPFWFREIDVFDKQQ